MIKKILYRYEREGGGVTVSTEKPTGEYTEALRLIADDGKLLTLDGEKLCAGIDVDDPTGWYEVDDPFFAHEMAIDRKAM